MAEKDIDKSKGLPPPEIKVTPEIEEHPEEPKKSVKSIVISVLLAMGVGLIIALLPTPKGLTPEGQKFLGLLMTVIILWVSEAIPIGVTALIAAAGMIFF